MKRVNKMVTFGLIIFAILFLQLVLGYKAGKALAGLEDKASAAQLPANK